MSDDSNIPCYVARCKCGCGALIYASVDEPDGQRGLSATQLNTIRKDNARDCAKLMRKGFTIERISVGEVRKSKFRCTSK